MLWLWIVIPFFVLCILVCLSYIRISVHFSRKREQERFEFELRALFGWVKYKKKMPDLNVPRWYQRKAVPLFQKFKSFGPNLPFFSRPFRNAVSRIQCVQLRWSTRIGIGDAAETAVSTGALWGAKHALLGFLFQFIQAKTVPLLTVSPSYHHPQISTEFDCTVQIRLGHLLLAGPFLLFRWLRTKRKSRG